MAGLTEGNGGVVDLMGSPVPAAFKELCEAVIESE